MNPVPDLDKTTAIAATDQTKAAAAKAASPLADQTLVTRSLP